MQHIKSKLKTMAKTTKKDAVDKAPPAEPQHFVTYSLGVSQDTMQLANDVKDFIQQNKLFQAIHGGEHVNVEGWQYAGARLGIVPIVESVDDVSPDGDEMLYRASVMLYDIAAGIMVGRGVALCSNKEQGKKYYQRFAIASMAQTRATGKAFRNILGWLITAAGYKTTPLEEMDFGGAEPEPAQKALPKKKAQQQLQAGATLEDSAKLRTKLTTMLQHALIKPQERDAILAQLEEMSDDVVRQNIETAQEVIQKRTPAHAQQLEEIKELAQHDNISDEFREKTLAYLPKYTVVTAAQAIVKLKQTINNDDLPF